ncbi:MAG: hypothetical protein A2Y10_06860 [Planctomycetes bacterium GWF2_41_51]|nr:MAG: hypothetical protein A2Y10_06860 [Planctomycetes bacterium GWF2_41_51]HBG28816.1 hypothetical protein [Phycisphaerales bacterium]
MAGHAVAEVKREKKESLDLQDIIMENKKRKLKAVGIFMLGFLAGGILLGGAALWNFNRFYTRQYYSQIQDVTNTAFMIRAGRTDELLKNIDSAIPGCVAAANKFGDTTAHSKERLQCFWFVQKYYDRFDVNVPAQIQPILSGLPPRPLTSCDIKKLKMKESYCNKPVKSAK